MVAEHCSFKKVDFEILVGDILRQPSRDTMLRDTMAMIVGDKENNFTITSKY